MTTGLDVADLTAAGIHEIKNLLGQLTLSLEDIGRNAPPDTGIKIADARFTCSRVVDQLNEILALYKLDTQRLRPSLAAHAPEDFLEDLMRAARQLTAGRIQIDVASDPDAPAFWFFDRDLVENALMNALHNALAHARSRITLRAQRQDDYLVLCVADDGAGYPPPLLQATLAQPDAAKPVGGLGLFFANRVAQAHENRGRRGRVVLQNTDSGGAEFKLLLP